MDPWILYLLTYHRHRTARRITPAWGGRGREIYSLHYKRVRMRGNDGRKNSFSFLLAMAQRREGDKEKEITDCNGPRR